MLFNSIHFIFVFMIAFLISYFLFDEKYRNFIILLYSILFYMLNTIDNPISFIILIFTIVVNYVLLYLLFVYYDSKLTCKIFVIVSIFFNILIMFIFKFEVFGVSFPIGFSFYVFHIISCIIDVNKNYIKCRDNGKNNIEKISFYNFVSYVVFFPKILTGPITRFNDFILDFNSKRKFDINFFINGFSLFSIGLGLKVLLSDNLYYVINQINVYGFNSISVLTAWLGVYSYTMKLYFDFAGYSLMAIGLGKILCFNLPINFNLPFSAISVTDFYRRWHISLMEFFKDYVYIPLGGNCNGNIIMQIRNIFIVWVLTILWHGVKINYFIWGISTFAVIALEKVIFLKLFNKYKIIGHIFIIVYIPLTFLIFSIEDYNELFIYLTRLVNFDSLYAIDFIEIIHDYYKIIIICLLFITPIPKLCYEKIKTNKIVISILSIIIFILSIFFINIVNADTFKYFRF